ncbi:unnamed protein product, partial [Medioppia subpectinata]
DFAIYEKGNVCVSGKIIASVDDNVLIAQHLLYDCNRRLAAAEHTIRTDDIYKELGCIGLDYKKAFRRLKIVGTDDYNEFYGVCEWDGQFVTYMDALLQSRVLSVPLRKLLLPVLIRKLRLDPHVMFDAFRSHRCDEGQVGPDVPKEDMSKIVIFHHVVPADERQTVSHMADRDKTRFVERFAQYSAEMPFYYNTATKQLVSPGVELEEVIAFPAPRRQDTTALVLDSQEFCPNDDNQAIDGCLLAAVSKKIIHKPIIPEKHNVIDISGDYQQWFGVLQDKIITAMNVENKTDNVWLVSKDSYINGIIGLMNCLRLEPGGENFRYVFLMDTNSVANIDFNTKPYSDILANDLVANVIKGGKLGTYRHFKLPADFDKCVSNEYYLNSGAIRDIGGLQWYDSRKLPEIKKGWNFGNKEVYKTRVNIYCAGVSFHDVMVASGRIPGGPEQMFTDCVLGCEYAGRRVDTGERVMGIDFRAFATSLNATINSMTTVPEHWSMAEAVTILSTYSTLYYALIKRANLKRGESVLIHSAAGGVGQAAINMCKHYDCDIYTTRCVIQSKAIENDCDIYTTVGTEEKKQFLINEYNIPEERIFGSRDVLFKAKLLKLTNGKGVDVVLNSLSGEKLDASYECVANSGRFIELGRYDMIQNKQIGMFDFARDIQFIGIVVDMAFITDVNFFDEFYDWVHKNSKNGCVKPLNYTLFEAKDADKAFRYMTTGKHMGKIVIKLRDEEMDRRPLMAIKPAVDMVTTIKTFFDPNKVYIITGGLGGFGLELIPWMQFFGARKFVTTSRSGLRTEYQKFIHNRMKKFYKNMKVLESQWIVSTADGFTIEGTKQLLREAQELGPIGGIFHLAIELNDCLLEKLTFEKFCSSIDTKHKIFANLDQLTRQLDYPLDYFVMFSSVTCGKGNAGQSNYSFGNSMCERICEERRRDGLHGLAVQYGPVGDVGVFEGSDQLLEMTTLRKQRINSCCDVLDKLLCLKQPVVTSYTKVDMSAKASSGAKSHIIAELWRALGIDPSVTPNHLTLGEIGLESMFAVELQQSLEKEWNINVSLHNVKSITIGMLKDYESGDPDVVKKFLDEIKVARAYLLKQKFIIPTETHTRLNAVTTGRPVYLMPTITMNWTMFEQLAQSLNRPVIGLNWTREMSTLTTLKQVNEYFVTLMKQLEPRGGYDVVGYLDGAIAAGKLLLKGSADKAVIIDAMADDAEVDQITDEDLLLFIFGVSFSKVPAPIFDRIVRDMKKQSDIKSQIRVIVTELIEFVGKGLVAPDIDEIYHIVLARLRMLLTYRSDKKKKWSNRLKVTIAKKWSKSVGKLIMIKPVIMDDIDDVNELIGKSRDAHLLPDVKDGTDNIEVTMINSGHDTDIITAEMNEKLLSVLK